MASIIFYFMLGLGIIFCNFSTGKSHLEPVSLSYFCTDITYGDEYNNKKNDEAKPPVLLIHGLHSYKEEWMELIDLFAIKTGRKICATDLRNHGASPWSEEYSIEAMVEDINLLLETLHFEEVTLLGHSLGGKVAVQFALTHPEKVEKVIIEEMRPNGVHDYVRFYLRAIKMFENIQGIIPENCTTEEEAKEAVYDYLKKHYKWASENIMFYFPITCDDDKCSFQPNIEIIEKMRKEDPSYLEGSAGICEKPALFIYGEKSPFRVGEVEEEIMQLFPKAKLVEVKGAGHVLNRVHQFKEEVIKFINEEE